MTVADVWTAVCPSATVRLTRYWPSCSGTNENVGPLPGGETTTPYRVTTQV